MTKAITRWNNTRAYVRNLAAALNPNQLALFENVCGEIDLDEEEIGEALHVSKFSVGDKNRRLALRALELAKIVEAIVGNRMAMNKAQYKARAKQTREAHKNDSEQTLRQAVVTTISNLQTAGAGNAFRVYIENAALGQIDKVSADLPLPGTLGAKQQAHENTYTQRLPNMVNVGPSVRMSGGAPWGVLPYLGEGNQDFVRFAHDGLRSVWTNEISYCVCVACLYGTLPEYTAMTFTHLPGGDVRKCNWDWMFLQDLPGNANFNYGLPSKVIVAYKPGNIDASSLECLDVLSVRVPASSILVYGFTSGIHFAIDKFGYFGTMAAQPTACSRYDQKPKYFS